MIILRNNYSPEERIFSKPILRAQQLEAAAKRAGLNLEKYAARQRGLVSKMKKPSGEFKGTMPIKEQWKISGVMGESRYKRIRENLLNHEAARTSTGEELRRYKRSEDDYKRGLESALANARLKKRMAHLKLNQMGAPRKAHEKTFYKRVKRLRRMNRRALERSPIMNAEYEMV